MSLFNKVDNSYTVEANDISNEIQTFIENIFYKYREYSIRELSHLAILAVTDAECITILNGR